MKLIEYQQSNGIALDEQLLLINNPLFTKGIYKVMNNHPVISYINSKLRKIFTDDKKVVLSLPKRNSILFIGYPDKSYDKLEYLERLFNLISKKSKYKYSLLIGKGDYELTEDNLISMPENLVHIFANNINFPDKRISYFPMGRDFRSAGLFGDFLPGSKKNNLVYCNFSLNTHSVRQEIFNNIKDMDFIQFEHMGEFLSYSISREQFFERLSSSKYSICPRGNGIDTFRLWDSLYLGTIPIVVKEALFHKELEDLPILFLESPEEFSKLTNDFLESKYQDMLNKEWNYEKLKLSYWRSLINNTLQ